MHQRCSLVQLIVRTDIHRNGGKRVRTKERRNGDRPRILSHGAERGLVPFRQLPHSRCADLHATSMLRVRVRTPPTPTARSNVSDSFTTIPDVRPAKAALPDRLLRKTITFLQYWFTENLRYKYCITIVGQLPAAIGMAVIDCPTRSIRLCLTGPVSQ